MKLEHWIRTETGDRHLHLVISYADLLNLDLTEFDRAVLRDCARHDATAADILLAAELLVRRLQESEMRRRPNISANQRVSIR